MRLIIAGGGTGGHLFPGIAVAEEFLARDPANEVLFVGTERGIEARAIPAAGYRLALISAAGIRGKGRLAKLKGGLLMLYGYAQSRKILKEFRPDLVLGVGGYASLPMVLAARGMEIRRFIHEQNAIPGMTNKVLARVAERVFITLDESAKYFAKGKTLLTGNPLRRQIVTAAGEENPPRPPFDKGGSPSGRGDFHLLVFGGSQGAHAINSAMVEALPYLDGVRERLVIVHQTGDNDAQRVREVYQARGYDADVRSFIDDMAARYRCADLVICRAGATTIAEVTACGKACIFIPFPFAVDDHQRRNAEALLKKEAGFILLERELTGKRLAEEIICLMGDQERVARTECAARGLARLDAARVIVDEMLKTTAIGNRQ